MLCLECKQNTNFKILTAGETKARVGNLPERIAALFDTPTPSAAAAPPHPRPPKV